MGDHDHRLEGIRRFGSRVVATLSWQSDDGERHHWAQALVVSRGKIVDLQDYESPARAIAWSRVRGAFG
jgi:hypothetical protein